MGNVISSSLTVNLIFTGIIFNALLFRLIIIPVYNIYFFFFRKEVLELEVEKNVFIYGLPVPMEYSEECFFTHCSIGTLSKLSGGVKNG
jgi:hypothetical protein